MESRSSQPRRARGLVQVLGVGLLAAIASADPATAPNPPLGDGSQILLGVGDRLDLYPRGRRISLPEEARAQGLPLELFQLWLPRGWKDSWIDPDALEELARAGTTPVVVHWFFGDDISKEIVKRDLSAWHRSLGRMSQRIAIEAPVLVILEPEFNNAPPPGDTPITAWSGFAEELREAARIVRAGAPNARVGVCAGDFSPTRNLETALGSVADELDFLAFQEMRAQTRKLGADYLEVGQAAVEYARYLHDSFGRPILVGYVAISSQGGWEEQQAQAIRDLSARRHELRRLGVFGLIYFQLRDDPQHTGYFGSAERSFGLSTAAGRPKPALDAFRHFRD